MTFGESIATCMANYITFKGKASRQEYWWFQLFISLVFWASSIVEILYDAIGLTLVLALLVFLPPSLAAGSRRLHDTERSGWRQLLILTIIGIFPLIYWLSQKSVVRKTHSGPRPAGHVRKPVVHVVRMK